MLMKRISTFWVIPLIVCSCISKLEVPEFEGKIEKLSVNEARTFFEDQFTKIHTARTKSEINNESLSVLSAGDFTPQWQNFLIESNEYVLAIDAPVISGYQYYGYFPNDKNPKDGELIEIVPKIIVVKSKDTEEKASFIAMLIPTSSFVSENKNPSTYSYFKPEMRFSGLVILKLLTGQIHQIIKYRNGTIIKNINMRDPDTSPEILVEQCNSILGNIQFLRFAKAATRSGGESGGNNDSYFCSWCNKYHGLDEDCDKPAPGVTACPKCNGLNICYCCPVCHNYPCDCFASQTCVICSRNPCVCADWCLICMKPVSECPGHGTEGGGAVTPPDPDPETDPYSPKTPVSLMDVGKFVGYGQFKNCHTACVAILKEHGIDYPGSSDYVFKLKIEVNKQLVNYGNDPAGNYRNAVNCIDRHLDAGRPIMVGVNHTFGRNINEGVTDHFVVIAGWGYDSAKGMNYYTYYEVGTSHSFKGCNETNNRFYYDPSIPTLYDEVGFVDEKRYDVAQIRPNDGNNENTIPQMKTKSFFAFMEYESIFYIKINLL